MRFFRHGDSLAIVLPEPLRKSHGVSDGEEYEFFEAERGVFVLVSRKLLAGRAAADAVAKLNSLLSQGGQANVQAAAQISIRPNAQQAQSAKREFVFGSPEWKIEKEGFAVIENELEAKRVSQLLESEIKAGKVMGVRGFDKKFYVVSSTLHGALSEKISKALSQKNMALPEIISETKANESAATAVLQVMREDGEVIEKKKGMYSLVK